MFTTVSIRNYMVPVMALMLLAGMAQITRAAISCDADDGCDEVEMRDEGEKSSDSMSIVTAVSCDIEDVCDAVDAYKDDDKSLGDSMNLMVEQCKQPLSGSSCPLDQVVRHCWHELTAKLEKCESKN